MEFTQIYFDIHIVHVSVKDTHREIKPLKKIRNYRKSSRNEVFEVDTLK